MSSNDLFPATLMPDADWWQVLWPDPISVLKQVGMRPGMKVIDLCCGTGYFTREMCTLIAPGHLYAVDLVEELLAIAKSVSKVSACEKAHFILADACNINKHVAEKVDMVFLANTFHGVPDKKALSASLAKVLKPNAAFVIVNWHKRPREETVVLEQARGPDTELRMSVDEVQAMVEPAGFTLDKIVDVGPYHYAAIFLNK